MSYSCVNRTSLMSDTGCQFFWVRVGALHDCRVRKFPRVLLIGSLPEMQQAVVQMLATHVDVDVVTSAATAFIRRPTDLVLANLMTDVPGRTGLVRDLRRNPQFRFVPIIVYASPKVRSSVWKRWRPAPMNRDGQWTGHQPRIFTLRLRTVRQADVSTSR